MQHHYSKVLFAGSGYRVYLNTFFKCLKFFSLIEYNDKQLHKASEIVQTKFAQDISPDIIYQMLSFRSYFKYNIDHIENNERNRKHVNN